MGVRSSLAVLGLLWISIVGCGPSAKEREVERAADDAIAARKQAEALAAAAEAEATALRSRLEVTERERDRARGDLDMAKRSVIDLQAEARKLEDRAVAAEAVASRLPSEDFYASIRRKWCLLVSKRMDGRSGFTLDAVDWFIENGFSAKEFSDLNAVIEEKKGTPEEREDLRAAFLSENLAKARAVLRSIDTGRSK